MSRIPLGDATWLLDIVLLLGTSGCLCVLMQRYTLSQFTLHTQIEQIVDTREQNLQLDLTFTVLDNQITGETKEGL